MPQNWQKLPLPAKDGLPPLLFKYISSPQGYEIFLTDLTYIWTERLNHKQVIQRAEEEETSVDPSEDAEQFKVLLQKVEDALCGAEGSSLTLRTGAKSNSLELITETKLPAPLHALQWTLYMTRGPQRSLTRELLLPLLREEANRERQQRSLLDHLKEKDWVIGKIFDKIESSGLDLSTVFPGTAGLRAGKRGTTRAQAEKLIRGVAPFDEHGWKNEISKGNVDAELAPKLVKELSDTTGSLDFRSLDLALDTWWEDVNVGSRAPESRGEKKKTSKADTAPLKKGKETKHDENSDDEFQRQATPPHLKRAKEDPQERPISRSNASSKSPTVSPSPSPEKTVPKPKHKGLGVIGGPKPAKREPPPRPPSSTASEVSEPVHRSPVPEPDLDQETASEDEEDAEPQPSLKPQRAEKAQSPKPRPRGLGVIGGKKAAKAPTPPSPSPERSQNRAPSATTDVGSASPSSQKLKPRGKLGMIGGGARNKTIPSRPAHDVPASSAESTASEAEDDLNGVSAAPKAGAPSRSSSPAAPPAVKQEKEPQRELTAQEKADKKREQLKRELEAKSKAPVKKKRKF